MTDKPILFNGAMVKAILDGRKTQTRRVLKPQPAAECAGHQRVATETGTGKPVFEAIDAAGHPIYAYPYPKGLRSPYPRLSYAPGDRIWVRETWNLFALSQDCDEAWPVGAIPKNDPRLDPVRFNQVVDFPVHGLSGCNGGHGPWRPSIHMPRWASRLTLVVTDVRVQRVQDIPGNDLRAEGLDIPPGPPLSPREKEYWKPEFAALWDSLNEKRGFGWDVNPWIAAVTFEPHQVNIDRMG